jgi:hypothetical protein
MTPHIHICNQQFNTVFCMSERFDNNPNYKIIKAVVTCKLCVPWWLIVWMVFKNAQTEWMNFLFLSKCTQGFHNLIPIPLMIKSRRSPPSTGQFTLPAETLPYTYPHKWGLSPLTFYWPSTGAKRRATCMQFPPQPLFALIHNSRSCGHKTPIPFLWLWLATFFATHLFTQTTSLP